MTKPIKDRALRKPGRKAYLPPPDAAETIEKLAADGFSQTGVARGLNVGLDTLRKWLDEFPALKEAFDQGRERERQVLHNALYRAATEQGNMTAAMFLLKARHGYREGEQPDNANRVSINFQLPGAMPLASFIDVSSSQKEEKS